MYESIRELLGLDPEELTWQDLSLCAGMDTNMFYDDYESDENVARIVDDVCLSCPVLAQCLERGTTNGEYGTWGGIFLVAGRPDDNKNAHKTQDTWDAIKEKISDAVL
jgi:hypothetical protein